MKKRTLAFKLIFGEIIAVLIPLMVVGMFASLKSSGALEELALSQSTEVAKGLANMTELAIKEETKIASQLANSDTIIDAAVKHAQGAGGAEIEKAAAVLTTLVKQSGDEYEV